MKALRFVSRNKVHRRMQTSLIGIIPTVDLETSSKADRQDRTSSVIDRGHVLQSRNPHPTVTNERYTDSATKMCGNIGSVVVISLDAVLFRNITVQQL